MLRKNLKNDLNYSILACSVLAIATFGIVKEANAATITLGNLTFSEYTTGFEITGGTLGAGTKADPFIIYEDVFSGDVTVKIEGFPTLGGNPANTGHRNGFWLRKVVTNKTQHIWDFYDHELQEIFGIASVNGDGLSFGQGYFAGRPFSSDGFADVNEIIDPRDFVNFSNGFVNPGETVAFNYVITDNSPISVFYLRQRPNFDPSNPDRVLPEPTPEPESQPSTEASPEPTPEPESQPSTEVSPEPTPEPESQPSTEVSPEPTPEPESQPSTEVSPEPTPEPESQPSAESEPSREQEIVTSTTPKNPPKVAKKVPEPTSVFSLLGLGLLGLGAIAKKS